MIGPALVAVITVDLARLVDKYGCLKSGAGHTAWCAIAGVPAGATLRLNIGDLKSLAGSDLIYSLAESGILQADAVEVVGTQPDGVKDVLAGLARLRDAG